MSNLALINAAPRLFECDVDRGQTEMPDYYLPAAPGVLIAGEDMLRAAGHRPGANQPPGWSCKLSGFVKTSRDGNSALWVQQCGEFWIIERSIRLDGGHTQDQTLVFAFELLPSWARTPEAAMRLAEYCDPIPQSPVAGCWTDVGNVRI